MGSVIFLKNETMNVEVIAHYGFFIYVTYYEDLFINNNCSHKTLLR